VDTAYTADLLDTAAAFQRDLQWITSLSLPLVTASAPDSGDIFLTLGNTARLHQPRAILAERTWCGGMPPKPLVAFLELLGMVSDPL
jgi:hypothetical protein